MNQFIQGLASYKYAIFRTEDYEGGKRQLAKMGVTWLIQWVEGKGWVYLVPKDKLRLPARLEVSEMIGFMTPYGAGNSTRQDVKSEFEQSYDQLLQLNH